MAHDTANDIFPCYFHFSIQKKKKTSKESTGDSTLMCILLSWLRSCFRAVRLSVRAQMLGLRRKCVPVCRLYNLAHFPSILMSLPGSVCGLSRPLNDVHTLEGVASALSCLRRPNAASSRNHQEPDAGHRHQFPSSPHRPR